MLSSRRIRRDTQRSLPQVADPVHPPLLGRGISVALLIVVTLVYAPVLSYEFLNYDDDLNIANNSHLYPPSWEGFRRFWSDGYEGLYIPLTYSTWFVLAGFTTTFEQPTGQAIYDPAIFHAFNLVLHALCVLLVYGLLVRLVRHQLAAAAGALLFALHPMQVESVAWVSETKGLLCTLLALLSIRLFCTFIERDGENGNAWPYYIFATMFFFLALLAKPTAVSVPLVLWLLEIGWWRRRLIKATLILTPWFCIAVGFVAITRYQQSVDQLTAVPSIWSRILIATDSLTFYLEKILWPVDLCPHYSRNIESALDDPSLLLRVVVLGLMLMAAAIPHNRHKWLTSSGILLVVLLPVLGFVPFAYQEFSNVADRYVYLAMLGPALAVSIWFAKYPRPWKIVVVFVVAFLLAVATRKQCCHWRDSESLFLHTLAVNPTSYRAENSLGSVYVAQGDLSTAISRFRSAIDLKPDYAQAHFNLSSSLAAVGNISEAIPHLEKVVELQPQSALARSNLGAMLFHSGRLEASLEHFRQAVSIDPKWTTAWLNLAIVQARCGYNSDALTSYDEVVELDSRNISARLQRADILISLGRNQDAIREYRWLEVEFSQQGDHKSARAMAARISELLVSSP